MRRTFQAIKFLRRAIGDNHLRAHLMERKTYSAPQCAGPTGHQHHPPGKCCAHAVALTAPLSVQGRFDAVQKEVHAERDVLYDAVDEEGRRAADVTATTTVHVLSHALQV